jgi:uncharacterized membrane protein YkvA (DUF1232 family)
LPITFEDVARLEGRFVRRGREIEARSNGSHIQRLREALSRLEGRVDPGEFARLSRYLLGGRTGEVAQLALGALDLVGDEIVEEPERARFALKFALQRLRTITGRTPAWSAPELGEREREEMEALFAAARGDRSYAEEELVAHAREFAAANDRSGHLFRKLASGLGFLAGILEDRGANARHREAARAALTYFREVSDAIPDDLGPVGLLDDAAVVQRAIAEIDAERGAIASLLDEVVREWPFLVDLSFGDEGDGHPVSEFLVVTAALLLDSVLENGARGSALALSRPGPLPFLIAILRALAEVQESLDVSSVPRFHRGEHLVGPGGSGEVEFVRYVNCHRETLAFETRECRPEEATHFEILQVVRKKKIKRLRRIEDLRGFRRSTRRDEELRPGRVEFDLGKKPVGALERLFGLTAPAVIRPERRRILLVGPAGETKRFAHELTVFGTPIVDLLPISRERLDGDRMVQETWTRRGPGGAPILTVVPGTAEALELAESDQSVAAVVAAVGTGTSDAANLCRIADGGRRVLAIPDEKDRDALRQFRRASFGFWTWSDDWLAGLDWPSSGRSESAALVRNFEREYRRRSGSRTESVELELPGLQHAFAAAHELESLARREGLERLAETSGECIGALVRICRFLAPPGRRSWERLRALWTTLEATVRDRRPWWRDEWLERFERLIAGAYEAIDILHCNNPKFDATMNWAFDHSAGLVAAPPSERNFLQELKTPPDLRWLDRGLHENPETPILVPAWYGRQRMERLLHPPVSRSVTLLLYGPEVGWFESSKATAARAAAEVQQLSERQRPFRTVKRSSPPPARAADFATIVLPDPDEVVLRGRRARAIEQFGTTAERTAEARLAYFVGGGWAAFTPEHRVLQLLSVEGRGDEPTERLGSRRASELAAGDLVLLVRGSDRDAIREAVDAIAAPGIRKQAAAWRRALEGALRSGRSYAEIQRALAREGCRRTLATLRGWVEDDAVIGPRDGDRDVDAILRATEDPGLKAGLDDCKRAIETLWRLHQQCGHRLAQEVVARVRDRLGDGADLDEVVEIEERVVLVVIESVDSHPMTVPLAMANRLQENA